MYFTLYCGNSLLPYHKDLLLKERINSLPEGELILFFSEAPNFEKGHNGCDSLLVTVASLWCVYLLQRSGTERSGSVGKVLDW